jgi:Domain of unknown function (DUF1707)
MPSTPTPLPPGLQRVGDADRGAAAERLSQHAAAGRLSIEELEERLDLVQRAVVADDLASIESDLPAASPRRQIAAWSPPRLSIVVVLVVVGVLVAAAVGHPIAPPFIAAVLLWRAVRWRRREQTLAGA